MVYDSTKRVADIIGSLTGIIITFPLLFLISILIKLNSRGPIFANIPKRLGKEGRVFRMYKFRSMIEDAHEILRKDPKYKELYQDYRRGSFKIKTDVDPRITRVGKFIRKTSLDELPQLFNILGGQMSLVGPRAFHADELKEQQNKFPGTRGFVEKLLTVKPGLTGPWQVSGRSAVDFPERVKLDADYTTKKSLAKDFKILLKTIPAVFKGEGT
jgi:lipopolysaccharide/colanic/teichoic acid biosynthesis glycosyltransferase